MIALIWQVRRWTQRIENGLRTLGERIDAQGTSLGERIETGLKTLRDEVHQQGSETRRTLDILLLQVAGSAQTAAGNSPLKLTVFGKRTEASLDPGEWIAATAEELRPKTEGLEQFEIDARCEQYVRTAFRRGTALRRRLTEWSLSSGQRLRRSSSRWASIRSHSRLPSLQDFSL